MKVLVATAELAPVARVGGLAAASAGYVRALRRAGVEVQVVVPDYDATPLLDQISRDLAVPGWAGPARARTGRLRHGGPAFHGGPDASSVGPVTLIESSRIRRPHPYLQPDGSGWQDNDHRFFAFSAAVAALVEVERPDIVHLNDWHTATALAHLATPPPTVLTIHTLGYQGTTDPGWLSAFPSGPRREQFLFAGACNPLVGGIRCADLVVAVSPHYAREITTPEGGSGIDAVLRDTGDRLVGILNGIDTDEWNPAADEHLPVAFDLGDVAPNKAVLRRQLLDACALSDGGGPVMVMVTRLVDQKGVDLVLPLVPYLRRLGARLIVLGSGDAHLVDALTSAAHDSRDLVSFHSGYDEALAHRMFAGGDVLVMPSRFEPCGLAQMQAMRYGTLPLVTDVGGLHDTVTDIDASGSSGTGVVIGEATSLALLDGVHRMARVVAQPRRREAMRRRGMQTDWSWDRPAQAHLDWYQRLLTGSV